MRFLAVNQSVKANIYGQDYCLKPLDPRIENLEDILVTDDFSASELFKRHRDILRVVNFDSTKLKGFPRIVNKIGDLETGEKILVLRNGSIGDHILFLPALRAFKELFPPDSAIWLSTQKEMHPVFYDDDSIDKLYPMPLRLNTLLKADYLIDFSGKDDQYEFTHLHLTDYFLNYLQIDYKKIKNKNPVMKWDQGRSPIICNLFEDVRRLNPNKSLVLLNWKASSPLRDIPPEKLLFLVRRFQDILFVVSQPKEFAEDTEKIVGKYGNNIFDCSSNMVSFEDYIAAIANCDAVVSTDTATGHLAEALGKPSLTIFGPISDDLRIRYYNKAYAIRAEYSGKTCRSPCGLSKSDKGCMESHLLGSPYSPCLLSIPEEKIYQRFKEFRDDALRNSQGKLTRANWSNGCLLTQSQKLLKVNEYNGKEKDQKKDG